ncbi:MAG TPA: hypothetical protein VM099_14545 [Gemmatimonadaceae bacterium]|nr:hypothetical protein [Gemmatimonadaceae bacterium]
MRWLLVGVLLTAGCTSSVTPLRGELFILQSIAGIPLPAPYAENPNLNLRIVTDSLWLTSLTTGERHARVEVDAAGKTQLNVEEFDYVRTDNHIEISFRCPPAALCVRPPHMVGTLTLDSFVVDQSVVSRRPLVYRRMAILE